MERSEIESQIAEELVSSLQGRDLQAALPEFSRLADDYESLALMNELPDYASPAQAALAEVPGIEALSSAETAALLSRVYRRALQLAGQ
ncbi:MAG: hypothetical protein AAF578_11210 [Pseudomonadota bacterium]